jgi:hypothetical protein
MDEQHSSHFETPDTIVSKPPQKRGKPGRKQSEIVKNISRQEVYDMANVGCTVEEIAYCLKVDPVTITRNFGDAHKEGHAAMCFQLRRKQIELAIKGNVTMLIFLGKSYLGQFDTQKIETKVEQVTKFETADELRNKLEELIANKMKKFNKYVA